MINKRIIDNFSISSEDLEQIRLALHKGHSDLFQQKIVLPFKAPLIQKVISAYPALEDEATDIIEDVLLKLRKFLGKKNYVPLSESIKDYLIKLSETECQLAQPSPENKQKK